MDNLINIISTIRYKSNTFFEKYIVAFKTPAGEILLNGNQDRCYDETDYKNGLS